MSNGASPAYVTLKWVLGVLATITLTIISIVSKWEHDRITQLEYGRYENRDRITRLEEKLDDKLEVIDWKIQRLTELIQQQQTAKTRR